MEQADINLTVRELAADLARFELDYAILGDVALSAHGVPREAKCVEVLVTQAGLTRFRFQFVGRGYVEATPGSQTSFRNTGTDVQIDFFTPGGVIGGNESSFVLPEPGRVAQKIGNARYADVPTLVATRLAAGGDGIGDSHELARTLGLNAGFAEQLPSPLRAAFTISLG
jgi:hypothetical protein